MRYFLTLAAASGLAVALIGCGAEPVQTASNDDTSNDQIQGVGAGGAPPSGGPPSQTSSSSESSSLLNEGPSAAGAGGEYPGGADMSGRPENPYDPNADPYENEQPGFSGAGGGYPGDINGRPDDANDPNNPGGGYPGAGQDGRPSGAGAGGGGSSPSAPGGGVPLPGGGNSGGGGGSSPSAPGGGVPLPGGGSGGGGGGSSPSAPGGGVPLPGGGSGDGGYGGDISGNPYGGDLSGGSSNSGNNQAAAEEEPKTLKEFALKAFKDGREDDAFRYMYGYYLTDRDGIKEHELMQLPHNDTPATAVRWGVGLTYAKPKDFSKDPPRIGTEPVINPRGGGRGGSPYGGGGGGPPSGAGGNPYGGGGSPYGGGGGGRRGAGPQDELIKYTGDFGEKLIERFAQRRTHQGGFYGSFLAELPEDAAGGNQGSTGSTSGNVGSGGAGIGQLNDDPINGNPYGGGNNSRPSPREEAPEIAQLVPGVMYFGIVERQSELLEKAKEQQLDAVILMSVSVDVNPRTGTETASVRVRLVDVDSGELVYAQRRALTNIAVWNDRQKGGERDDMVDIELDKVFKETADEDYRLADLSLTPPQAEERVSLLTASEPANPLPALAEIRFYHTNGLLDDRGLAQAYQAILGDSEGKDLATGTEEEKVAAIQSWLPGESAPAQPQGGNTSGGFR